MATGPGRRHRFEPGPAVEQPGQRVEAREAFGLLAQRVELEGLVGKHRRVFLEDGEELFAEPGFGHLVGDIAGQAIHDVGLGVERARPVHPAPGTILVAVAAAGGALAALMHHAGDFADDPRQVVGMDEVAQLVAGQLIELPAQGVGPGMIEGDGQPLPERDEEVWRKFEKAPGVDHPRDIGTAGRVEEDGVDIHTGSVTAWPPRF